MKLRAGQADSVHGQRPESNNYLLDGSEINNRVDGGYALKVPVDSIFRKDKLDTRNFFSRNVEPLKQNQFGGTVGGPIQKDRLFYFGYYEGFRNRQGFTQSAAVHTEAQKRGDFSGCR